MKKQYRLSTQIICASFILLSACGRGEESGIEIIDNSENGNTGTQTATHFITQTQIEEARKKGESALQNGWFYVVHRGESAKGLFGNTIPGEDIYYPVFSYTTNFDAGDDLIDYVKPSRMEFFTTENENEIPTLFLSAKGETAADMSKDISGSGSIPDRLIYYSTDTLLDVITWERFFDLKYTVGAWNLRTLTNGRIYANLDKDADYDYILPDSELYEIYNLNVTNVLFDKIGGVPITEDMIDSGVLIGATKSRQYDLEVYAGSYFRHYLTTANIRAMRAYEQFASIEYETKQNYIYEIKVPDYFVDGFYRIGNKGMLRIIHVTPSAPVEGA